MNRAFCWLAFWRCRIGRSVSEHAAHHAAHHSTDEATGIPATTATAAAAAAASATMTATATPAAAALSAANRLVIRVIAGGGRGGRDDFRQQPLVRQLVEEAGLGIAPGGLPARNHGAGRFVELARHLGVETKSAQTALNVAALTFLEAALVFRGLVGILSEGGAFDAGGQITGRGRRTVLQRGDPGQRQRFELPVWIGGQIGVELFRLVRFLDRAPELEFDVGTA